MVEAYFEWKAAWYFAGLAVMAIIAGIYILFRLLVWLYLKMCQARKKRLEMLEEYYEDKLEPDLGSAEYLAEKYNIRGDADGQNRRKDSE